MRLHGGGQIKRKDRRQGDCLTTGRRIGYRMVGRWRTAQWACSTCFRREDGGIDETISPVGQNTPLPFRGDRQKNRRKESAGSGPVSYTHLRANETRHDLV